MIKKMIFTKVLAVHLVLLIALALVCQQAIADGMASVKLFYDETKAVRANFHQVVTDKQGRKLQDVYGQMQLKRPNKFRWDYNKPFEQQIISDGKRVWLYDTELAQVTVREFNQALGSSPAALLAGDDAIEKSFKLINASAKGGLDWVSASPKAKETGFDRILLGFKDNKLQEMSLIDSFGHNTKIVFSQVESNPVIDEKAFLFQPPKGVDVVGE
jgi:outer membrane lipoprotein carrier protein